jgi:hypothetical protein
MTRPSLEAPESEIITFARDWVRFAAKLITWSELQTITNLVGTAIFIDVQTTNDSVRFYRGVTELP